MGWVVGVPGDLGTCSMAGRWRSIGIGFRIQGSDLADPGGGVERGSREGWRTKRNSCLFEGFPVAFKKIGHKRRSRLGLWKVSDGEDLLVRFVLQFGIVWCVF